MAHLHEKIDFTVEVFVVYQNTVLLRKHDKYKIWLSVGGHIELNEDPNEAAIREVKEEVGLDIALDNNLLPQTHENSDAYKELIPPYFLNRNRMSPTHEHVTFTYFAESQTDVITELVEREKSTGCRWFTKGDLQNDREIIPHVKYYALQALEKLSH